MRDEWKRPPPIASESNRNKPVKSDFVRDLPITGESNRALPIVPDFIRDLPIVGRDPIPEDCIEPTICLPEFPCIPPGQTHLHEFDYTSGFPYAFTWFDQWFASESDRDAGINELTENIPRVVFYPTRPVPIAPDSNTPANKGYIRIYAPMLYKTTFYYPKIWIINRCCAVPATILDRIAT